MNKLFLHLKGKKELAGAGYIPVSSYFSHYVIGEVMREIAKKGISTQSMQVSLPKERRSIDYQITTSKLLTMSLEIVNFLKKYKERDGEKIR